LYVVDFYRQFVEHPGYVPEEMRNKVDWRIGAEHGRIWRIHPKNWKPKGPRRNLSRAKSGELINHLSDANAWWRQTAQRLLLERQDTSIVSELVRTARKGSSPVVRLHALYTLDGLGALRPDSISTALCDSDPQVREHGIRLSEQFIGGGARVASPRGQASLQERAGRGPRGATSPLKSGHDGASPQPMDDLQKLLLKLVEDEDARVRLQLALALDAVESEQKLPALARLTELGGQDRWQSLAVLTSVGYQSWRFWTTLYDESRNREKEPNEANAQFADKLGTLLGASLSAADWQEAARWLSNSAKPLFIRLALFDALTEAAKRDSYLRLALGQSWVTAAGKPWSFDDLRTEARTAAASPDTVLPVRRLAIRVLGKSDPNLGRTTLLDL